jgi:hypothetical protein
LQTATSRLSADYRASSVSSFTHSHAQPLARPAKDVKDDATLRLKTVATRGLLEKMAAKRQKEERQEKRRAVNRLYEALQELIEYHRQMGQLCTKRYTEICNEIWYSGA